MTEAEWLACDDPMPMLEFLWGEASDRKLRLFAVACCKRVVHLPGSVKLRRAVEVVEQNADGLVSNSELAVAQVVAHGDVEAIPRGLPAEVLRAAYALTRGRWQEAVRRSARSVEWAYPKERLAQSDLLRCVFGNSFRPMSLDPPWLTWRDATLPKLAQAVYDDRAFDRLPILADALEDAGCDNADILDHCRRPGEHVRGCWVVDLLLGKT
jgi:hypothetical protein